MLFKVYRNSTNKLPKFKFIPKLPDAYNLTSYVLSGNKLLANNLLTLNTLGLTLTTEKIGGTVGKHGGNTTLQ